MPLKTLELKLQQSNIELQPYVVEEGGYSAFDGVRGYAGLGVKTEKPVNDNCILYTDTKIGTGKTSGLKTELGWEHPFNNKVAADVSIYSGIGNRYPESKIPEGFDDVDINSTNSKGQVIAYENHILYGAGANANLKFKNENRTWTVGFKGGYQGAYNTEGKKEGASFDLQNKSGWFAGIQAGGEFRIDDYLALSLNAERRYTQNGAYNGITGGLSWYF